MQIPSWEGNLFVASQGFPRISRNPKVNYSTHKRPPPVSILGQRNPAHIPTYHLLEIHSNIIHPSTPRYPQWSPYLRFPHQDTIHPLSSPIRATYPAHLILLDFITRKIFGEEYKSFSSSLSTFTSSLLGTYIFLNTIFSNILTFLSSLYCSDHVSHPYKTTGKIIVLYILICSVVSYSIIYTCTEIHFLSQHLLVFRKSKLLSRKLLARHFKTQNSKNCTKVVTYIWRHSIRYTLADH